MKTIFIAIGNPLRGDDGAAQAVISMLKGGAGASACHLQLTPEAAAEIAAFDRAVFLDADPDTTSPLIEPADNSAGGSACPTLSHHSTSAQIVGLARVLFGFAGEAWLCRIPAYDFSPREGLSRECLRAVNQTCVMIEQELNS